MAPKLPPRFRRTVGKVPIQRDAVPRPSGSAVTVPAEVPDEGPRIYIPGAGVVNVRSGVLEPLVSSAGGLQVATRAEVSGDTAAVACLDNGRNEAPKVKRAKAASMACAIQAAGSAESRQAALDDLEFDKVANSARASRASTWSTWTRLHHAWFGDDVDPLPLTVHKIKAVAALFKAGHYLSFANYASRAKAEHIEYFHVHGVCWSEELSVEMRNSMRSITRGAGPSKQSFPLDISKVLKLGPLEVAEVTGGPVGVTDFIEIGTYFLARELEIACAKCGHFHLDILAAEVTWNLPVSKNDILALGTHRTWGCICASSVEIGCPFHAALRQMERVRRIAMKCECDFAAMPFFPNELGQVVTKATVVATINSVVAKCGLPVKDAVGRPLYGGHSLRTGGAVLLSSLGLETTKIEAMARWNSPMLLYYIRSAPLKSITKEISSLLLAKSSSSSAKDGQNTSGQKALAKSIGELSRRLDKSIAAFDEREQRLSSLEAAVAPIKYIRNHSSGVWHHTREHAAGRVCYTACGWNYTGLSFDISTDLPSNTSHKFLCGTCLPKSRFEAMVA